MKPRLGKQWHIREVTEKPDEWGLNPRPILEDAKAHYVGDFFREEDFVFPEDSPLLCFMKQSNPKPRTGWDLRRSQWRWRGGKGVARMERQENLTPWLKSCQIQTQYQWWKLQLNASSWEFPRSLLWEGLAWVESLSHPYSPSCLSRSLLFMECSRMSVFKPTVPNRNDCSQSNRKEPYEQAWLALAVLHSTDVRIPSDVLRASYWIGRC